MLAAGRSGGTGLVRRRAGRFRPALPVAGERVGEPQAGEQADHEDPDDRYGGAVCNVADHQQHGGGDGQARDGQSQDGHHVGRPDQVALQMAAEHHPVVGDRAEQQRSGDGGEQKRRNVERALGGSERGELAGEREGEQVAEDHLDAEPGHPQLLEQFGQVPVVAFGFGLAGPVPVRHPLATGFLCGHDPALPRPNRPKRLRGAGPDLGAGPGDGRPGYDLSCSILSLNSVVAIVALRGWPFRKAWANFFACWYSTFPGSGGSSGLTFTSTMAGPSWASAWVIAARASPGRSTLMPSAPLAAAKAA